MIKLESQRVKDPKQAVCMYRYIFTNVFDSPLPSFSIFSPCINQIFPFGLTSYGDVHTHAVYVCMYMSVCVSVFSL